MVNLFQLAFQLARRNEIVAVSELYNVIGMGLRRPKRTSTSLVVS